MRLKAVVSVSDKMKTSRRGFNRASLLSLRIKVGLPRFSSAGRRLAHLDFNWTFYCSCMHQSRVSSLLFCESSTSSSYFNWIFLSPCTKVEFSWLFLIRESTTSSSQFQPSFIIAWYQSRVSSLLFGESSVFSSLCQPTPCTAWYHSRASRASQFSPARPRRCRSPQFQPSPFVVWQSRAFSVSFFQTNLFITQPVQQRTEMNDRKIKK